MSKVRCGCPLSLIVYTDVGALMHYDVLSSVIPSLASTGLRPPRRLLILPPGERPNFLHYNLSLYGSGV